MFRVALVVEGALVLVAVLLGRLVHLDPLATWILDPRAALVGAAAALPPIAALCAILCSARPGWRELVRTAERAAGPLIAPLALWQVLLLSALAGLGEEALFRGLLQAGLAQALGGIVAVGLASLVFGVTHLVTAAYAVVATVMGLYLGWLFQATDNLAVPAVVHALYDAAAMLILKRRLALREGSADL